VAAGTQRVTELQEQLADATPLIGARRRRRAAEQLAELARQASPDAIAVLLQVIAGGAEESVYGIAASALHSLPTGAASDILCRMAVENGDRAALKIAVQVGYAPSELPVRAVLLALAGRWQELDTVDIDGALLRAAYETAAPNVRRRLAAAAREVGRAEWVQVVVGGRRRLRLAQMTPNEWQDVLALLADPVRAKEAWRLAQDAPPLWGRELLLRIAATAVPECDREDFARLRALAAWCGEGEVPFSVCTGRAATLLGHESGVASLSITAGDGLLASGSWDNTIRLWRLPDGECVATLRGHQGSVLSLAAIPGGSLLASGSSDNTVRLWHLPDGECMATFRGHEGAVLSLAAVPGGSLLASGSSDNTVRVWYLPEGDSWFLPEDECMATLWRHGSGVTSLAVTPDGNLLASGSHDKTICLWRLPDGAFVATLSGHEGSVVSLAAIPGGSLLASGSTDNTIRLWHLQDGECMACLRGHERGVASLTIAAGGSLLASGSWDKTIRLWHLPDGECAATLRGHEGTVLSLAAIPGGSLLASGSSDNTIRLWRPPVAAPAAVLARDIDCVLALRAYAGLTRHEHAWLDFMLALVDLHRRFDVEVEVVDHVEVGEFDIEIGE